MRKVLIVGAGQSGLQLALTLLEHDFEVTVMSARTPEEIRGGRSAITAIDAGFTRALATILDSNITTFIAAAVLFFIGTGPVRGFAVTLGIGIITSLFTAFTMTRTCRRSSDEST